MKLHLKRTAEYRTRNIEWWSVESLRSDYFS